MYLSLVRCCKNSPCDTCELNSRALRAASCTTVELRQTSSRTSVRYSKAGIFGIYPREHPLYLELQKHGRMISAFPVPFPMLLDQNHILQTLLSTHLLQGTNKRLFSGRRSRKRLRRLARSWMTTPRNMANSRFNGMRVE